MATMPARGDVWLVDLGSADLALFVSSLVCRFNDGPTNGSWIIIAILPFAIPWAILKATWLAAIRRGRAVGMKAVDRGTGSSGR
jgi:hypothetical protein